MDTYLLDIGGTVLNPTVPPEAVTVSGGGREVHEEVSVTGLIIRTLGHRQARRVQVTAPAGFVLRADQAAALSVLHRAGTPLTLTLGLGYPLSGTFTGVTFEGDAQFSPKRTPGYAAYSFTLYLPQ